MSRYKKVEEEKPSADSLLLKEVLSDIASKPSIDNKEVFEKIASSIEKAGQQQLEAYQKAQEAFLEQARAMVASVSNIKLEASQEVSEPVDVEALLEGMAKLIPEPAPMPAPVEPIDIEGIIKQVLEYSKKEAPTYTFNIERNHSGVLVGITATPEGEV